MKSTSVENNKYYGETKGKKYLISDPNAAWFYTLWQTDDMHNVVIEVLQNETLWGANLSAFNGFANAVEKQLELFVARGVKL